MTGRQASRVCFAVGDAVLVKSIHPPGHVRTPCFCRGHKGRIAAIQGNFGNPENLAYGRDGKPEQTLYRIEMAMRELWPDYAGSAHDTLIADIYGHWLEPDHG